jgi:hypothetical protein
MLFPRRVLYFDFVGAVFATPGICEITKWRDRRLFCIAHMAKKERRAFLQTIA